MPATKGHFTLALLEISHIANDLAVQNLQSIQKVVSSKVLAMVSRSSTSEEEKTRSVLFRFLKDYIPPSSVKTTRESPISEDLLSHDAIVLPTPNPRICKQL